MTNEERVSEIKAGKNKQENLEALFFENMPLWVSVIRPFTGLCDIEDLKQQAFLSVAEAVKRYDAERGAFAPFACRLIVQDLPGYIVSCGNGLSFPAWYGKRKGEYKKLLADGVTDEEEQAELLGVSVQEVRLLAMASASVGSLNTPTEAGEIGEVIASDEDLEAAAVDRIGAEELRRDVWEEVEKTLDGRRLDIIKGLFLRGESLASLALRYNVTVSRIGQIKERALDRLRASERMQALAIDYEFITVFWWRCGLNTWKQTGASCVERYIERKEVIDRKKRRLIAQILQEEEEQRRKREEWEKISELVEKYKKERGA